MKNTYRHYIGNDKYHFFKSFKIYLSYRLFQNEQTELYFSETPQIGVGGQLYIKKIDITSRLRSQIHKICHSNQQQH